MNGTTAMGTAWFRRVFFSLYSIYLVIATMPPERRLGSSIQNHDEQPARSPKVEHTTVSSEDIAVPFDDLASANARIRDLGKQIQDLHAFLNVTGMTRSKFAHQRGPPPFARLMLRKKLQLSCDSIWKTIQTSPRY